MLACLLQSEWNEKMLLLFIMGLAAEGSVGCPKSCICASDLLSCVRKDLKQVPPNLPAASVSLDLSHNGISQLHNNWLFGLPRIHILRLSHNHIRWLPSRAFHNATTLQHLDLSFNYLQGIQEELFEHLNNLEELLLYKNSITRVDYGAFIHLSNIQKIYLSWNNLTNFSFNAMQNFTNPNLRTLDLSSNQFLKLPVEEVSSLPAFIKNGLYLHNNPLTCHCSLFALFIHWDHRGFSSVVDFYKQHTCRYMGRPNVVVQILQAQKGLDNCSVERLYRLPEAGLRVLVGKHVMITCNTSLPLDNTTYMWITPTYDFIMPPGNSNQSLRIHQNGSLEISKAQTWNSGIYVCIAVNRRLSYNSTHEVNVSVHYPKHDAESFNTGITTLLGCVVSLVLVFIYLYMTPCRCFPCCIKPPQPPSPPHESSGQSTLCGTPPATEVPNNRKASRHVVFLEPIKERRWEKKAKVLQLKIDSDSSSSVFSDSPIVYT
ncbi:amphoterin-induced protein 3 [Spea bombifrons]|uniref:amphoterin-induced protein 3 n=1 Tax=Spea bombifrons TaxID=233779 RepID=UPI00234A2B23|nr:amphoterin-induced protein 3 [Spea bombifrons]